MTQLQSTRVCVCRKYCILRAPPTCQPAVLDSQRQFLSSQPAALDSRKGAAAGAATLKGMCLPAPLLGPALRLVQGKCRVLGSRIQHAFDLNDDLLCCQVIHFKLLRAGCVHPPHPKSLMLDATYSEEGIEEVGQSLHGLFRLFAQEGEREAT